MEKKVFVIIVTYNGMNWIEMCLSSLSKSTLQHFVIVIDNDSKDATVPFIKKNYPGVKLIEQKKNIGFGKANNIGLSYALKNNCDFVFLLNQDALIESKTLENLVDAATKNEDFGVVSPIHLNETGDGLDPSFLYYIKQNGGEAFLSDSILGKKEDDIYSLSMINAAAWLMPRKTLNIVGGFSPQFFLYGEDDNYCQRLRYHSLKLGVVPNAFIQHHSNNEYAKDFKLGSPEYYRKFINRLKINYGDVNIVPIKQTESLKRYYFKKALISFVKMEFKKAKIYLDHRRLVGNVAMEKNIQMERMPQPNYLDI